VLAKQGITAAVLKYRLPNPESSDQPNMVPLSDARRALKLLKENAHRYGVKKDQVGVMGFSAGSHPSTVTCLWKCTCFQKAVMDLGWVEKKMAQTSGRHYS
jgi:acetyl esterase/lipase